MINFINTAHAGVISGAPSIPQLLSNTLTFLLQVFGILGIISLVVSGMYYFSVSGDAEQAKRAKKGVTYSVIGVAIVLGAMVILRTIVRMLQ